MGQRKITVIGNDKELNNMDHDIRLLRFCNEVEIRVLWTKNIAIAIKKLGTENRNVHQPIKI